MREALFNWIRRKSGYQFPRMGRLGFDVMRTCFPKKVEAELFPGIRVALDLSDDTHLGTFWHGRRFEQPTGQVLEHWCHAGGGPFFDMGANYGFFSAWILSACPETAVHAFEPNPVTFAVLNDIRVRNKRERLHAIPFGLSDNETMLDLYPGGADLGQSTFAAHAGPDRPPVARVRVLTFDQYCVETGLTFPPAAVLGGKDRRGRVRSKSRPGHASGVGGPGVSGADIGGPCGKPRPLRGQTGGFAQATVRFWL